MNERVFHDIQLCWTGLSQYNDPEKPKDIFDSIDDEFVDEEKYSYDIVDNFSEEAYRKIYE